MTKQFTIVDYLVKPFIESMKSMKSTVSQFPDGEFTRIEVTCRAEYMKHIERRWNEAKLSIEPMYYRGTKLHANAFDKSTKTAEL